MGWPPLDVGLPEVAVGALGVWRITHLLQAEDGPWDLGLRLRRVAGDGFWGRLLGCFYCLSLWVSAAVAVLLAAGLRELVLLWPALSGGAILIQRSVPAEAKWEEDP